MTDDLTLVLEAVAVAAEAHAPQRRKTGHQPYVNHVLRVGLEARRAGLSAAAIAAAVLHDVVEDTPVALEELAARFPPRVIEVVRLMTQWWPDDAPAEVKRTEKPRYYAAILADAEAIAVKLLDRADNLEDMVRVVERERTWAARYLSRTEEEMAPLVAAVENEWVRQRYLRAFEALRAALARP